MTVTQLEMQVEFQKVRNLPFLTKTLQLATQKQKQCYQIASTGLKCSGGSSLRASGAWPH
uniref:Uncharacterized protein n=1 Tax=Arion vulgaris TaxID=1028688 RepID=A0A0B7B3N9_9EUPU